MSATIGLILVVWGISMVLRKVDAAIPLIVFGLLFIGIQLAMARDLGQWENTDPEISAWYRSLKQPDSPLSCCGEADSYYCDEHSRMLPGGVPQIYCVINDERDDAKLKRTHIDDGTEIIIPPHKLNKDANKVGRAIVFLSSGRDPYCFIGAGGF